MKTIFAHLRAALCLLLVCQLAAPGGTWAAAGGRDLEVEALVQELKEGAALWVLTVGVSQYEDARIDLKFADHDAKRIAKVLKSQEGLLFREVFTRVLVNEQATREEILKAMSEFLGQAGPGDVILIFMAGHGLQDRQTGTYYFVPHNASGDNLVYAGLPMPMFEETVKRLRTNVDKLILWMDTCHAGAVSVAARGVNVGEDLAEALKQASGQYVLSASKAGEESLEDEAFRFEGRERGHGAFTYSILRGLQGGAADTTQVVWLSDLFSHVSKEVPRLTRGKQHPHGQIQGTDLPLFVVDESALAKIGESVEIESGSFAPVPSAPSAEKKGSRKWLWLLLAVVVSGGAAVVLKPADEAAPEKGSVAIDVLVP